MMAAAGGVAVLGDQVDAAGLGFLKVVDVRNEGEAGVEDDAEVFGCGDDAESVVGAERNNWAGKMALARDCEDFTLVM